MGQGQWPDGGFHSDVTPPPRPRATAAQLGGRIAFGIAVTAGLIASVALGTPALRGPDAGHDTTTTHHSATAPR
ncbi:hypothetical protein ACIQGZ_20225 [Streptomyces sp. NPDC092296]|uniref:hypothetical protein n=1 Tax=Streptomyces sp. NPDC092296 TaxID=3366012 RepID=UPI0038300347